jgi:Bacterial protein of unknown function (DUF885)
MRHSLAVALLVLLPPSAVFAADDLAALGRDFWTWRAQTQPLSSDDIPRIERPAGWTADWSTASIARRRAALADFERRWTAIPAGASTAGQVDYRLLGSAMARVRWELDLLAGWRRNPTFYVEQALCGVFDLLTPPPPFDAARSAELVRRLESIPSTLADGRTNLDQMRAPFVRLAIEDLSDIRLRLKTMATALAPLLVGKARTDVGASAERAALALEAFGTWLSGKLLGLPEDTAVGRAAYLSFLRDVALMPFTPEQLVAMGRQELDRALAFEAIALNRSRNAPPLALLPSVAAVVARETLDETSVRRFLAEQGLLTVPSWTRRYLFQPFPAYLLPLANVGVPDDLTSPQRLDQNGTAYVQPPTAHLGYFQAAAARDPRLQIVHEGAHYLQAVLSWANPDVIRRHYYDSGANEGIAFYDEEMMLQAGLFDDSPRSRDILYNMMRLRALRVEVDVKLALGEFSLKRATKYLVDTVPMDPSTARSEVALFSASPGQAISYQIGKLQILRMLADARLRQGDGFRLLAFHDFLFANGNVPLSLQRWEMLGLRDEVDVLATLR